MTEAPASATNTMSIRSLRDMRSSGFDYTGAWFTTLTTIRKPSSSYGYTGACYTELMTLPIPAVQQALKKDGLDGWLLYDFHGSNPIARRLTDLTSSPKLSTRRWYYLVPSEGAPRGLVHAIERHNLDGLPGEKHPYAGREQLADGLKNLLRGMKRVAMEYSPGNAIPYVSRVDAGTVEAVRQLGVDVVSSGDLIQRLG